ncbi:PP2C family protein-serine/threonine phosphatase [Saprospiraceae bacterium]|nr:PP2C family protein-serine/threonine phosphatase [Saprospiraceae bacterium]
MISAEIARIESLEKELSLKQLQIKSLLTITQAINDNVPSEGLYKMYKNFLSWEMGINKMALFIDDDGWKMVSKIDQDELIFYNRIEKLLLPFERLHTISDDDPLELQDFDILIPVRHKEMPIAYALIGGIHNQDDVYNRVQFITTITNMIAVATENKRLFKKQISQERFKKEIELAEEVQKMLIPENLPSNDFYELSKRYRPHMNIGGDYIDYVPIEKNRFMFCIADISGKGVGAALLMANFQAVIQSLVFRTDNLEVFVNSLNETVYRITKSDKYITFFVCEVDLNTNKMRYINAGHQPPFLFSNGSLTKLDKGTTIIGAFDELPFIESGEHDLKAGDLIFSFTDGLIDLMDDSGVYFEDDKIEKFVEANGNLEAEEFNSLLISEIEAFKGTQSYTDDIAIITCKIRKINER